ncbi:MAG: penicillin-binding protein 2, partial [Negativicutes bacterium]|nr:penicillin-binding protein 2 [Negativicutes bacterium]
ADARRIYPLAAAAAPVTGYYSEKYGKSGIEAAADRFLTGFDNPWRDLGPVAELLGRKRGDDVRLTIDSRLQQAAYQALAGHRGAVVLIDVNGGGILAMASRPTFDPATVDQQWTSLTAGDDGSLLNRASQGLYPPGSVAKIITLTTALAAGLATPASRYEDTGQVTIGRDYVLQNDDREALGTVSLEKAFALSSNTVFASLGLALGDSGLAAGYHRFGFDREIPFPLANERPHLPDFPHLTDGELAQVAIGQGSLLVTPLRMAMAIQAVANRGTMLEPQMIVGRSYDGDGGSGRQPAAAWLDVCPPQVAGTVAEMMRAVVEYGTARFLAGYGVNIAGKTGTAQNPHGQPHSWFVGFAPYDRPQVAVAVVVENAGYGAEYAGPVAGRLLKMALEVGK